MAPIGHLTQTLTAGEPSVTRRHHPFAAVRTRRRPTGRDQSGAALVEFSLVVGLFAFILYGLVSFGMVLATKQKVTAAASDGARAAVGASTLAMAQSQATS